MAKPDNGGLDDVLVYYALMSPLFMTSYSTVVPDSLSFFCSSSL